MEFNEDPFKDANHRYGDPFDLEGADPFAGNQEDPFTAPVSAAFGAGAGSTTPEVVYKQHWTGSSAFSNQADPFAPPPSTTGVNYSSNENDPFGGTNWDTLSKSSTTPEVNKQLIGSAWSTTTPEVNKQLTGSAWGTMTSTADPFGNNHVVPVSNNLDDSFDPFSAKSLAKSSPMALPPAGDPFGHRPAAALPPEVVQPTDPFGSSTAWKSEAITSSTSQQKHDPFSAVPVTRSKTSSDAFADFRNNTTGTGSSSTPKISNSTGSGLPPPNKTLNPLQKSETTASVLKTSQSLSRPWSSSNSTKASDPFGSTGTGSSITGTGNSSTSSIPRSRPSASSSHHQSSSGLVTTTTDRVLTRNNSGYFTIFLKIS